MSESIRVFCGEAPNDKPGWVPRPLGVVYDVRLNGELVRQVVAADSIDGELWRYTDEQRASHWQTEKLTGVVEIERA